MGDRGLVYIKGAPCAIYVHFHGRQIPDIIRKALPLLRSGDPGYAMARLIGVFHEQIPDRNTGLGVVKPPSPPDPRIGGGWSDGPGDSGMVILDINSRGEDPYGSRHLTAEYHGGTLKGPADFGELTG